MKTRQSHIAETICPMPAGHDTRHGACGKKSRDFTIKDGRIEVAE